jgi:hypothetical protein
MWDLKTKKISNNHWFTLVEATYEALTVKITAFIKFFADVIREVALSSYQRYKGRNIRIKYFSREVGGGGRGEGEKTCGTISRTHILKEFV